MSYAPIDGNSVPTLIGVSEVDGETPVRLVANPTTGALVIDGASLYTELDTRYGLLANPLSQFASTTSLQLAGVISDETGTGSLVFADTPTLVTPELGVATATSLAVPTITTASGALTITPASGSNLNITLATTGDFVVNTNQLYVDTSKGFVGIGTTSPSEQLHVYAGNDGSGGIISAKDGGAILMASNGNFPLRVGNNTGAANSVRFRVDVNGKIEAGSASYYSTATSPGFSFFGDNDTGIFSPTANTLAIAYGGNEAMRITSGGNVGIGTTGPSVKLHIAGTAAGAAMMVDQTSPGAGANAQITTGLSGTIYSWYGTAGAVDGLITGSVLGDTVFRSLNKNILFSTDNGTTANVYIKNGGNVGIGTTAPGKKVEINSATGDCLRLTYNDADGSATVYTDFAVSSGGDLTITPSGDDVLIVGNLTLSAKNLITDTTTGMKIGTATGQKIAFFNSTPIVQPTTAVAAATFVAGAGTAVNDASTFDSYTIKQVVKALRNLGVLA